MIGSDSLQLMLARLGFANITKLSSTVQSWKCDDAAIVAILEKLATAPDRDLAFSAFARLIDSNQELPSLLAADAQWMDTLARVLGSSVALGQFLAVNPTELETLRVENPRCNVKQLRRELLRSVGADPDATVPIADPTRSDDLRRAYHHAVLQIAARDVTAADQLDILPDIAVELSALADGTVEAALALARGEVSDSQKCRLGIIAMGKAGAKELNYVSDVDLIFVAEPALDAWGKPLCDSTQAIAVATKLASALSRICSDHTSAGTIWKIDPNLRPEGKQGALVRTLSSYQTYYEKWAKNWEFQALMKARPMAGDIALAGEFVDMIWPMVWSVADDDQFVPQMQAMRQRVISLLSPKVADREIKLGAGGLRDVEFTVQLLQLVHGRADERLRLRGTFEALEKLVAYGYVGRQDGNDLASAYRLLRVLEHRLQLYRMQRTHLLPADDYAQTWLARGIGLEQPKELTQLWRATTRKVLTLHHRMFYSPLLEAVARIPTAQVRLTSQAAQTRLQALGYSDPKAALKHIAALSQGMSRQAEIQRQILPAMLGWFTQGPNPDHGLLAFRQVSEKLGRSPWYLRALRDGGITAQHFAKILASSRYAVDLLLRNPQSAALLGDTAGLVPVERETILDEMLRSARRHESVTDAAAAIRSVRRRELLRLAMGNLIGDLELSALGKALSDVTSATIDAGLDVAKRGVSDVPEIAVIALGRWGGQEMSYASDADAMFVCDDIKAVEGINAATTVINRLRSLLSQPGPDPALMIDADLRPEGKGGAIVRSASSYASYYQRWSSTWEMQALLRANFGAGSQELAERLLHDVVNGLRYPSAGLTSVQIQQIRMLKARMESERVQGNPLKNVKLGSGGLSDVEWVVQLLQLQHVGAYPQLRETSTMRVLETLEQLKIVGEKETAILREAWVMASRIRDAIMLFRGRPSDLLPVDVREFSAVAGILGYQKGESSILDQDYHRVARLARKVMDRFFWGDEGSHTL